MCSAMVVCLLFGGCRKEEGAMRFSLFTEAYSGGAKVTVDGLTSSWHAGDHVKVNGVEGAVGVDAQGQPYLDVTVSQWGGSYYAAYPASAVESCTESGLLTLTLPQEYQYREDNSGHQLLELPMVACSSNDNLVFKHLTGALVVKVPSADRNIVLDYIMVKSSTSPLSGRGTVQVDAANPQVTFSSDTTHTVVMFFDRCPVTILSSATETKDIMIPVAPTTGEGHKFTVTVCAHSTWSTRYYYLFNKESTTGNMERNIVAGALISFPNGNTIPFLGRGSDGEPYLIQNKEDYKHFLDYLNTGNGGDKWYKLVNDIDFGGDTVTAVTEYRAFSGKFDGNGKCLSNVSVTASWKSNTFVSLFPAITGGWVRNISVENVTLLPPQSGGNFNLYVGGFTSFLKSFGEIISMENIQVSNISVNYLSSTPSFQVAAIGGIVGKVVNDGSGSLSMTSCGFCQRTPTVYSVTTNVQTLCFGGLVGDATNTNVSFNNCSVGFGGESEIFGATINSNSSRYSHVGSAFGRATVDTITIVNSLLLEGRFLYIGTAIDNVKKIIGSHSNLSGEDFIDASRLSFWRKSYANNQTMTEVTVNY